MKKKFFKLLSALAISTGALTGLASCEFYECKPSYEEYSKWLNGTTDPTAELGKVGDYYINTSTSDIFVKQESGWVKLGNIEHEDGDTTIYANTIISTMHGYVSADVASGRIGTKVKFTIDPEINYGLSTLIVNNKDVSNKVVFDKETLTYSYQTEIVAGGLVVVANF